MRTLPIIVVIIVLLLGGSLSSYRYIQVTSQSLEDQLEMVEKSVTTQKWDRAQEELATAQQHWSQTATWWTVLLDHRDIDTIDISMERLEKYIATQDISLSLGEIEVLILLFAHIHDSEQFNLRNIL
ncbi:MAG TPA: DUF4363 family protein [Desulfosporosinus sp.]|nr:DUF4363 family protein [Desulfosporosinus sp.]